MWQALRIHKDSHTLNPFVDFVEYRSRLMCPVGDPALDRQIARSLGKFSVGILLFAYARHKISIDTIKEVVLWSQILWHGSVEVT